jgi:hypothetical protein
MSQWLDQYKYPTRPAYRATTLDLWRRFYGADPAYTSAAFAGSSRPYIPFVVHQEMTIRRLGVFNGSTLTAGNLSDIGLYQMPGGSSFAKYNPLPRAIPFVHTGPFEREGTSVWQWQAILQGEAVLPPGGYAFGYSQIDGTSHVMQIHATGASGFHRIAGMFIGVAFPTVGTGAGNINNNLNSTLIPILGADGVAPE